MKSLQSETTGTGKWWTMAATLLVAGFLIVGPASLQDAAARDCQSGESEEQCTERETAICLEKFNDYHVDWVMDCLHNAKGLPAKSEGVCATYHSLQPIYAAQCEGSPSKKTVRVTCAYLKQHKAQCG